MDAAQRAVPEMMWLLGKAAAYFIVARLIGSFWPCDVLSWAENPK